MYGDFVSQRVLYPFHKIDTSVRSNTPYCIPRLPLCKKDAAWQQ